MTTTDPTEARAVAREAFVYGYAILFNYRTIHEQVVDWSSPSWNGGFDRFRHHTRAFGPSDRDVVTPNNDTPYSWAWLDLRREPLIVEVPEVAGGRYYTLQVVDLYTHVLGNLGVRAFGSGARRHLIAGPGWQGAVPDGIASVLRSETNLVGILGRTASSGPEDLANVREIQNGYRLVPLSEWTHDDPPALVSALPMPGWRDDLLTSFRFVGVLSFLLGLADPHPSERALLARFASIGIVPGQTFDASRLPASLRVAIEAGLEDGKADLDAAIAKQTSSFGLFGSREELANDYLKRAIGASMGLYGNVPEEAVYVGTMLDARGEMLDGKRTYRWRFAKADLPKVRFFWSVTLYGLPDRLLVANPIDRYSIGDRTRGLRYGDDGSLEITLSQEAPKDARAKANWLPAPGGPFTVVLRAYGPDETTARGEYVLPPVERTDVTRGASAPAQRSS